MDNIKDILQDEGVLTEEINNADTQSEEEVRQEVKQDEPKQEVREDKEEEKQEGQQEGQQEVKVKKRKSRAEKRIKALIRRNKELEEELVRLKSSMNKPAVKKEELKEPDIDDYETYDEYLKALEEYENKLKQKNVEMKQEIKEVKEEIPKSVLDDIVQEGIDEYGDEFSKIVQDPTLPLPMKVLKHIVDSDFASDIIYYLGKNRKVAEKLAGYNRDKDIIKAITRLEVQLENEDVLVSKAPEPIKPVKSKSSKVSSLEDDDISYEEFERQFLKEFNKKNLDWL